MGLYLNLYKSQRDVLMEEVEGVKSFYYLKLKAIEFLMTFWSGNQPPVRPYLYVDYEKLHRMYIVNDDGCKIVSFGFEFLIKTYSKVVTDSGNSILALNYKGERGEISLQNVSEALSVLSELEFKENSYYWGVDSGMSVSDESIRFFEKIVFSEPGYIRYDNSMVGYKPLIHPRYHFDICFTPKISYKLGLPQHIERNEIERILDKATFCPMMMLTPSNLYYAKIEKGRRVKRGGKNRK